MVIVTAVTGCGAAPAVRASAAPFALLGAVPAQATFVMRLRPAQIAASPATRELASDVFDEADLDSFRARHGVDLRTLDELIVVSTDDEGTAYLARGDFHAPVVVAELGHRMTPIESQANRPFARVAGIYLNRRLELVALDEQTLLVVDGAPALTGATVAARTERAPGLITANPEARALLASLGDAPIVLYRRGALPLPPEGIGLVLARLDGLGLSLAPASPERLAAHVELTGTFPPGVDSNLRTFIASFAATDLGVALGLDSFAESLQLDATEQHVRADGSLSAAALARGLHILLRAEIADLAAN